MCKIIVDSYLFFHASGLKEVVSLLLRHGANPNAKDNNGKTTLHELVRSIHFSTNEEDKINMLECLDVFLDNDGEDNEPLDLEAKCSEGFSALNHAIFSGIFSMTKSSFKSLKYYHFIYIYRSERDSGKVNDKGS